MARPFELRRHGIGAGVLNAAAAVLSIALCRTSMQPVAALTVAWCAH